MSAQYVNTSTHRDSQSLSVGHSVSALRLFFEPSEFEKRAKLGAVQNIVYKGKKMIKLASVSSKTSSLRMFLKPKIIFTSNGSLIRQSSPIQNKRSEVSVAKKKAKAKGKKKK